MSDDEMTPQEMGRSLTRIEDKLDKVTDDHETRLRALEKHMWMTAAGAGAGGTALVGLIVQVLTG